MLQAGPTHHDIKSSIAPLLTWIRQNAQTLRAEGRWPLQQEDIPAHLLPQWQLYKANKHTLTQASSKAPAVEHATRDKAQPTTGLARSSSHPLQESSRNVGPGPHLRAAKATAQQQLPGTPCRPALPDTAQPSPLVLAATPLSAGPKARSVFTSPTKDLLTPTAAHKTSNSLQQTPGPQDNPDCIPATNERPGRPSTLDHLGQPSPSGAGASRPRCLSAPRRALFSSSQPAAGLGTSAAHVSSPARPALVRRRKAVPVADPPPAAKLNNPSHPIRSRPPGPASNPCSPLKPCSHQHHTAAAATASSCQEPTVASLPAVSAPHVMAARPPPAAGHNYRLPSTPSRLGNTHRSPPTSPTGLALHQHTTSTIPSHPTAATVQHDQHNPTNRTLIDNESLPVHSDGGDEAMQSGAQRGTATTPSRPAAPGDGRGDGGGDGGGAGELRGVLGRARQLKATAPLISPVLRRFGPRAGGPQGLSFQASAAARDRCRALESPRHRLTFKSPGKIAHPTHGRPDLTSPLAGRSRPAHSLLSPTRHGTSPMLRNPRYDISDVLLGSPSPWKAPRPVEPVQGGTQEGGVAGGVAAELGAGDAQQRSDTQQQGQQDHYQQQQGQQQQGQQQQGCSLISQLRDGTAGVTGPDRHPPSVITHVATPVITHVATPVITHVATPVITHVATPTGHLPGSIPAALVDLSCCAQIAAPAIAQGDQQQPQSRAAVAQGDQQQPQLKAAVAQGDQQQPQLKAAVAQGDPQQPQLRAAVAQGDQQQPQARAAVAQVIQDYDSGAGHAQPPQAACHGSKPRATSRKSNLKVPAPRMKRTAGTARAGGVSRRLASTATVAVNSPAVKQSMGSRLLAHGRALVTAGDVGCDAEGCDALGALGGGGDGGQEGSGSPCLHHQPPSSPAAQLPARAPRGKRLKQTGTVVEAFGPVQRSVGLLSQQQQLDDVSDDEQQQQRSQRSQQQQPPRRTLRSRAGHSAARYVMSESESGLSEEEGWSPTPVKTKGRRRGGAGGRVAGARSEDRDSSECDVSDMSEGEGDAGSGSDGSRDASPQVAMKRSRVSSKPKAVTARAVKRPGNSSRDLGQAAADAGEPRPKRPRVSRAAKPTQPGVLGDTVDEQELQARDGSTGVAGSKAGGSTAARGAGGAGTAKRKPTATKRKPAERNNFVKISQSGSRAKFSFNYQSKSAASGRAKASRTRLRRINGKIVRVQFKAPAMAGQGADVLEGFKSSTRCFICGQTGHWASRCPSLTGQAPEQLQRAETERADAEAAAGLAPGSCAPAAPAPAQPTPRLPHLPQPQPGSSYTAAHQARGGAAGAGGPRFHVRQLMPNRLTQAGAQTLKSPDEPFQLQDLLPPDISAQLAPVLGWPPATPTTTPTGIDTQTQAGGGAQGNGGSDDVPAVQGGPESVQGVAQPTSTDPSPPQPPTCAQQLQAVGQLTDAHLQGVLRGVWGHESFRGNQVVLIRAALEGRHVAGVLPTGAGKSLCYQLPALLLPGVTLVVSPLLALMRDQLLRLPPGVPGAMLWGGQTREEAEVVLQAAAKGALKLLYVAPEKLHNPVVLDALKRLPHKIPLVCVDEAHCVSEWGHSFRPAYYRLGAVLRNVLKPRCIMALTATATLATQRDMTQVLGLPQDALVRELPLRDNLRLQVVHMNGGTSSGRSCTWLITQLRPGGQLAGATRVIAYVAFQAQADDVAQRLNKAGIHAVAYHAGKDMNERLRVQEVFSAGHARVVVATIAFGMGVDQQDLGAVVHMQMPRSMEDYVQQVGRAGRDGSEARCFLLLDAEDFLRLRSLGHSNAAERQAVGDLLARIFQPLQDQPGGSTQQQQQQQSVGPRPALFGVMPIKEACVELELELEVIEAVMSNLQGPDGKGLIAVLPQTCTTLDIRFHHTAPEVLARTMQLVRAIVAAKTKVVKGIYKVAMSKLVAAAGMSTSAVVAQLSELARQQEIHFELSPARALAWRVVTRVMPDLDALADQLYDRLIRQEQVNIRRLDAMYVLMALAARQGSPEAQEASIRSYATQYFNSPGDMPHMPLSLSPPPAQGAVTAAATTLGLTLQPQHLGDGCLGGVGEDEGSTGEAHGVLPVVMQPDRLAVQVAAFLHSQQQNILQAVRRMHGTAVARIFHGLSTPAYPSDQWRKCGFWGRYSSWDFRAIVAAASPELNRMYGLADQEARRQQQQQQVQGRKGKHAGGLGQR